MKTLIMASVLAVSMLVADASAGISLGLNIAGRRGRGLDSRVLIEREHVRSFGGFSGHNQRFSRRDFRSQRFSGHDFGSRVLIEREPLIIQRDPIIIEQEPDVIEFIPQIRRGRTRVFQGGACRSGDCNFW